MGKFKKAFSLLGIGVLSVLLLFTACEKGLPGKTVIRAAYWGDVKEVEIIQNSVARFKERNPGIEVKLEKLPAGDAYIEKLLTQIAGGTPVDVMFVNAERYVNFSDKGILLPLNELIEKEKFPVEKYYPQIVRRFTRNGKIYALPRDIAPIAVVYYNKDMFDRAGLKYPSNEWDWNTMLETAKKLTKKNSDGTITYGFADDWPIWEAWVLSNGGKLVDDTDNPKRVMLDSKEALAGFKFRQDMMYKHKVMPSPANMSAMGGVGASDMFVQGKAAMFYSGIWKTPFFREIKDFKWDAVMFPKGPSGKRGFVLSGAGYAVSKSTKHPEEAFKLVTFLAGEEGQTELARTGLAQPAIMKIAASPDFLDGKAPSSKKFLLEAVKYGTFEPAWLPWVEAKNKYLYPAMDKIWSGEKAPEEVMPAAVSAINKELF